MTDGWVFHQGDIGQYEPRDKGAVYMQAKTEAKRIGPASWHFRDVPDDFSADRELSATHWERVRVPHDYIIAQKPDRKNNFALGGFHYENAWYRYHFHLTDADRDKRISFYFEGVATHCVVYVNGCTLWKNECGYTSFEVDVTDFVSFAEDNVVAVYVDAVSQHEGWWYEGAGIYRPVWMIKTELVSVDLYGVYVHPEKKAGSCWNVPVEVTVRNDTMEEKTVRIETMILDPMGNVAAVLEACGTVALKDKETFFMIGEVAEPLLWDVENPRLYTAFTRIYEEEILLDETSDRFGFRTLQFDAEKGFFLNGKHVYLKGVNCHQDYGLTGKAVPERVQYYRLRLLKEMGANAFRTSHYPHSQITMDALDEMGFLVLDETRWFSSSEEGKRQLEMLVKRDRNHPCVILWSIGNEEPFAVEDRGLRISRSLSALVKKLDGTRPVTAAIDREPSKAVSVKALDVLGINYHLDEYEPTHKKYPKLPLVATECCATGTTRGWYFASNADKQYLPAYDRDVDELFLSRERTWKFLKAHPYIMGCFQWDGIEHRGEAVYPRLCSQSGALDLYLQKKDAFYQNQSHWTDAPMAHLLPHWNWEGREGEEIRVVAYTNCQELELFLNGVSRGRKRIEPYGHGEWNVAYAPGTLEVKGYRAGEAVCADRVKTSGAPARLRLRLEDDGIKADGEDVAILTCCVEDADGTVVPDAAPYVSFFTNEFGSILGTGSDISDQTPPACSERKMRAGLISVAVRAGKTKGMLRVWAKADGLAMASLEVPLL